MVGGGELPDSRSPAVCGCGGSFPIECQFVLETLGGVYANDAEARRDGLSPPDRLRLHHECSGPLMETLRVWFEEQFRDRKVEPNSGLGKAIQYFQRHRKALTLFLREPGRRWTILCANGH